MFTKMFQFSVYLFCGASTAMLGFCLIPAFEMRHSPECFGGFHRECILSPPRVFCLYVYSCQLIPYSKCATSTKEAKETYQCMHS